MNHRTAFVDTAFPLRGDSIPMDHGYHLFAALSRHLPALHEHREWGIHPVLGQNRGGGKLGLFEKSRLRIRLPASEVGQIMPLAQAKLDIAGSKCTLGFPRLYPLRPTAHLTSRLVIIKGHHDTPEQFEAALRRQVAKMPGLGQDPERVEVTVGLRRILRIKKLEMVGYAVALGGLETHGSLAIQIHGLGGRRHMGAGVFIPPRGSA